MIASCGEYSWERAACTTLHDDAQFLQHCLPRHWGQMAFWAAAHWVVQYSLETNALQAVQ